jgi:hypothetical protein
MEKMMKQMGKGKMPNFAQLQNGGQQQAAQSYTRTASATKKSKNKRKKKARK